MAGKGVSGGGRPGGKGMVSGECSVCTEGSTGFLKPDSRVQEEEQPETREEGDGVRWRLRTPNWAAYVSYAF